MRGDEARPNAPQSHHESLGLSRVRATVVHGQAVRVLRASQCVVSSFSLASGFRLGISRRWMFESLA